MINTINERLGNGVIVSIQIDTESLENLYNKAKNIDEILETTIQQLGDEARDTWIKNAENRLKNSSGYIRAVEDGSNFNPGELEYKIEPEFKTSELHNDVNVGLLVEYGYEPFDMKAKLSTKHVVQFEYSSPGEKSENTPQLNKEIYQIALKHNQFLDYPLTEKTVPELFSGPLANSLNPYSHSNNLLNSPTIPGITHNYSSEPKYISMRLRNAPTYKNISYRKPPELPIKTHQWQNRQFKGLTPTKITGGIVKTFSTFRTISPHPPKDPKKNEQWQDSWIHPGLEPKWIFRDMTFEMGGKIKPTIEKTIQQILGQ